jgi:tRNA G18 (ribose-2'-O)-methylase SpoU
MKTGKKEAEAYLALVDIRSAENVGAIFRTADALGISTIYLVGYTPDPIDRFNRARKDVAKAALGAEKTVPWEHVKDTAILFKLLKKNGLKVIAIEQDKRAVDYKKVTLERPTCFLVGNEVTGLPKNILKKVDIIAEIPMQGEKESLNVSVATGIALARILNL